MRLRQRNRVTRLLNGKASGTIGTLQILETVDGNTGSSGGELKQTGLLLSVPGADDLPEILDNLILLLVATVVGVLLPVIDVDIGNTTDEQLQLALVEDIDKIGRNELVETGHESVELLLDSLDNLPLGNQPVEVSIRYSES